MTASVINATVNGINATGGNTAELELQVGGTTAITINSAGYWVLDNALPAASGGTGINSAGTAGNVLTSNGTAWVSQAAPSTGGNASYDTLTAATGFFDLPSGTTAQRPVSPAVGMIRYNTTNIEYEVYSGSAWVALTTQTSGLYAVQYLVIAGGGGGGDTHGGGGGAGGYLTGTSTLSTGASYSIVIGAGGASAASSSVPGSNGVSSTFNSLAAIGGGGGGSYPNVNPTSGGSGGGLSISPGTVGSGTSGQGNAGSAGSNYVSGPGPWSGGGGGGAGAVGGGVIVGGTGGNGGAGLASSITGTSVTRAGGGGANGQSTGGTGGAGGGGNGGSNTTPGTAATVNTGSGGGGSGSPGGGPGGAGGSGIVIISYAGAQRGTGGTVTTSGGNTIHTFTSSGTYTA